MWARIAGAVLLILLLAPFALTLLQPSAPDEIACAAVAALERRDAEALYRLGDPGERKRAGITVAAVRGYLADSLYREGDLAHLRIVKVNHFRPNCVQYLVETDRLRRNGTHRAIIITVEHGAGEPFHLALGEMLWNCLAASVPRLDPDLAVRIYRTLAKKTGIHNFRTVLDGWRWPDKA